MPSPKKTIEKREVRNEKDQDMERVDYHSFKKDDGNCSIDNKLCERQGPCSGCPTKNPKKKFKCDICGREENYHIIWCGFCLAQYDAGKREGIVEGRREVEATVEARMKRIVEYLLGHRDCIDD